MSTAYDAVIVGSGPNGLAAAITLARTGCSVLVLEAHASPGGGLRSEELTLPGFVHDVCAAILPLGLASPFFRDLPLEQHGLEWVFSPAALAHPFDDGTSLAVERSVADTAAQLGADGPRYERLLQPLVRDAETLIRSALAPLHFPARPLSFARFGSKALLPAATLARRAFAGERARALFAGMAGHAIMPLEHAATAAFGLILSLLAHTVGWPMVKGGSGNLAAALVRYLNSLGGKVVTGWRVQSIDELPPARAYVFDVTPRQLLALAGHRLPAGYRRRLARYRYGPGVCKVDYAMDGPVPWRAAACNRAATVHLGGTLGEIAAYERGVWRGEAPDHPFVIMVQPSLFDPSRVPKGKHTVWAYCHVPHGSNVDCSPHIEAQIERFAPGFGDRVVARKVRTAVDMEAYNANYVGGDINGGVQDIRQLFTRPAIRRVPYATPAKDIFICSSSTPPGGGVHGMCGYHAAQAVMRNFGGTQAAAGAGRTRK